MRTLKVYLTAPDPDVTHKWRNFGEAVWRELRDEHQVSLDEIDKSVSEFFVRGIHKRDLRTTAARIRELAAKHLMSQIIHVSEVEDIER